jgi:hypothetical protein
MGKSSLIANTAIRLQELGIRTAVIDLNAIGTQRDDKRAQESWYFGIAHAIHAPLGISFPLKPWWIERSNLPAVQRLIELFRCIALEAGPHGAAIFLDEIETTTALPFSSDFFAAIRATHNARAFEPVLSQLTFALVGSATPDQLINDPKRTPFNIGHRIDLSDFTLKEAASALSIELHPEQVTRDRLLQRVLYWTDGHPYLTQTLCLYVSEQCKKLNLAPQLQPEEFVESLVSEKFLSPEAQRSDKNISYLRSRLPEVRQSRGALKLYARIHAGEAILDDPKSLAHSLLKLFGIVKASSQGILKVRNQLYRAVFTAEWAKEKASTTFWFDEVAESLSHKLLFFISRYRRKYLEWMFYRHRDFDVKGLTTQSTYNLELEQVFVDLVIEPRPAYATSSDPLRHPVTASSLKTGIWEYMHTDKSTGDHFAIVGPPGGGKTTLLRQAALQLTKRRPNLRLVPILLFLRDHIGSIQENPTYSLSKASETEMARKQGPSPPDGWFEMSLQAGRCLVLLDGLDEVGGVDVRRMAAIWIETQITSYPRNRFIIASRPHGYRSNPLAGVTVLEIQPFDRTQIYQFVHNWYRANEIHASGKLDPGVEMKANEGAVDLLNRLRNSQTLADLAVNPLLLTMIANIHRFRSSLPGRRVELYSEIFEVFLGKRQRARGIEGDLTPAQKQRVLQPLAYYLMCAKRREIPIEEAARVVAEPLRRVSGEKVGSSESEFLREIENNSGLLLEREHGIFSFTHLVFQEYLAAVHLRENALGSEVAAMVADPWWHEVLRLYGAQGDGSGVIQACFLSEPPTVLTLALAIDVLEEAREVDPFWRAKVDVFLKEGLEDNDPERFRLAAETLLARRLRNMIALDETTFVDSTLITCAEYQLFFNERRAKLDLCQPADWQSYRFPVGRASSPVEGVRSSDAEAFCDWLNSRDSTFSFQIPTPKELEQYQMQFSIPRPSAIEGIRIIKERRS